MISNSPAIQRPSRSQVIRTPLSESPDDNAHAENAQLSPAPATAVPMILGHDAMSARKV